MLLLVTVHHVNYRLRSVSSQLEHALVNQIPCDDSIISDRFFVIVNSLCKSERWLLRRNVISKKIELLGNVTCFTDRLECFVIIFFLNIVGRRSARFMVRFTVEIDGTKGPY